MAEHDGAAEEPDPLNNSDVPELVEKDSADAEDVDAEETDVEDPEANEPEPEAEGAAEPGMRNRVQTWFSSIPGPIAVSLAMIVALLGLGGWLGFRVHQDNQVQEQRNLYVQVARQTAINLTTINYTEVDADIKRVLDSATGAFHDEFQNRSQPFIDVVKKAQSKTEGSISEAGLLSATEDQAQVLIAVAVKTSMAGSLENQEP